MIACRTTTVLCMLLLAALSLGGCDEPKVVGPKQRSAGGDGKQGQSGPDAASQAEQKSEEEAGLELTDDDFVESDTSNRNPFRSYAKAFEVEPPKVVQRRVLMPNTAVDQMRLIAIISGLPQPRAMLTDPTGVGHVVKRGDYIGRAEVIQAGGAEGMPVTLNWRVDRIRSGEVVLTREDPTAPNKPPLTRVLPLYEDEERAALGLEE